MLVESSGVHFTSQAGRPKVSRTLSQAARFIGRIPPSFVGKTLRINIPKLTLGETNVAIAFDFDKKQWAKESSNTAQAFERQVLLKAKGDRYTEFDIEANGCITASEKYGPVQVTHKMKPDPNTVACPVSKLQADSRLAWVVAGKERHFCCVSCIIDFVDAFEIPPKKR